MTGCAAMLATISLVNAQDPGAHQRHWGNALEHMTKTLNLTPDQQAKVRPIIEQAKPQIVAIRQEARQKIKVIRDNISSQIRPLLTPTQQQKFDAIQKAREDMLKARQEMRAAAMQ
jgi:Spy/CpxP family protein refolding chaperone